MLTAARRVRGSRATALGRLPSRRQLGGGFDGRSVAVHRPRRRLPRSSASTHRTLTTNFGLCARRGTAPGCDAWVRQRGRFSVDFDLEAGRRVERGQSRHPSAATAIYSTRNDGRAAVCNLGGTTSSRPTSPAGAETGQHFDRSRDRVRPDGERRRYETDRDDVVHRGRGDDRRVAARRRRAGQPAGGRCVADEPITPRAVRLRR